MWERWFRADFYDGAKVRRAVLEGGASDIGSMPHFALCAVWTSTRRTVAEVNKWDRGLESTETEVNSQEWGLGFSLPSPLGQPLRDDMFDVRENIFSTVILASHSFLQFVAFIGVVVRL